MSATSNETEKPPLTRRLIAAALPTFIVLGNLGNRLANSTSSTSEQVGALFGTFVGAYFMYRLILHFW